MPPSIRTIRSPRPCRLPSDDVFLAWQRRGSDRESPARMKKPMAARGNGYPSEWDRRHTENLTGVGRDHLFAARAVITTAIKSAWSYLPADCSTTHADGVYDYQCENGWY